MTWGEISHQYLLNRGGGLAVEAVMHLALHSKWLQRGLQHKAEDGTVRGIGLGFPFHWRFVFFGKDEVGRGIIRTGMGHR